MFFYFPQNNHKSLCLVVSRLYSVIADSHFHNDIALLFRTSYSCISFVNYTVRGQTLMWMDYVYPWRTMYNLEPCQVEFWKREPRQAKYFAHIMSYKCKVYINLKVGMGHHFYDKAFRDCVRVYFHAIKKFGPQVDNICMSEFIDRIVISPDAWLSNVFTPNGKAQSLVQNALGVILFLSHHEYSWGKFKNNLPYWPISICNIEIWIANVKTEWIECITFIWGLYP